MSVFTRQLKYGRKKGKGLGKEEDGTIAPIERKLKLVIPGNGGKIHKKKHHDIAKKSSYGGFLKVVSPDSNEVIDSNVQIQESSEADSNIIAKKQKMNDKAYYFMDKDDAIVIYKLGLIGKDILERHASSFIKYRISVPEYSIILNREDLAEVTNEVNERITSINGIKNKGEYKAIDFINGRIEQVNLSETISRCDGKNEQNVKKNEQKGKKRKEENINRAAENEKEESTFKTEEQSIPGMSKEPNESKRNKKIYKSSENDDGIETKKNKEKRKERTSEASDNSDCERSNIKNLRFKNIKKNNDDEESKQKVEKTIKNREVVKESTPEAEIQSIPGTSQSTSNVNDGCDRKNFEINMKNIENKEKRKLLETFLEGMICLLEKRINSNSPDIAKNKEVEKNSDSDDDDKENNSDSDDDDDEKNSDSDDDDDEKNSDNDDDDDEKNSDSDDDDDEKNSDSDDDDEEKNCDNNDDDNKDCDIKVIFGSINFSINF